MKTKDITRDMTLEEIRTTGLTALEEALGSLGMIKFLQIYYKGSGDYTRDRHKWLKGMTIDQISEGILQNRNKNS